MSTSVCTLDVVRRQRPEWAPWLGVLDEVLNAISDARWEAAVPRAPHGGEGIPAAATDIANWSTPLLAEATLSLPPALLRRLLRRLIRVAVKSDAPNLAALDTARSSQLDACSLFSASLGHQRARVREIAAACDVESHAVEALADLLPVPFLQACHRRWASSIRSGWSAGYCPVCGAWPAFAEVRGIERTRCYRCGRCGGEWGALALCCPYCTMRDHHELVTLVPEGNETAAVIDACTACRGYVKTVSRLQGCQPECVLVEDLATVALDLAALEHGFTRPDTGGCAFDVTVFDGGARGRFSWWSA
jgi:FdhE protein